MFNDGTHHLLVLGPKHKLNPNKDKIWFLKIHVNNNTLGQLSKCLTKDLELMGKAFTNEFGRETTISRLSGALIAMEAGMKIIGH